MKHSTLVAVIAASGLIATATARAQTPANDDITQAVHVEALPFSHTVDLSSATESTSDLDCSGLADTHTVWYRVVADEGVRLGLRVQTEVPEVSVAVGTGEPGSLSLVRCTFSSTTAFDAAAGVPYYIQLATAGETEGGPVTLSVEAVEPLAVDVSFARQVQRDAGGIITVTGTIRCSRATPPGSELVVQGTLVQGDARGWLVPVHFTDGCGKRPQRWRTAVQLLSPTSFTDGRAELTATAFACDPFVCAEPDRETAPVRLR